MIIKHQTNFIKEQLWTPCMCCKMINTTVLKRAASQGKAYARQEPTFQTAKAKDKRSSRESRPALKIFFFPSQDTQHNV